jgi:cytoskeleton protein RodZ
MEKVANLLRQTREHQHMSLEEAAQRTHIPLSYLALLEGTPLQGKGRSHSLPDPLYLVPHLRKYSTFLGLDPGFMTAQFATILQDSQEKSMKIVVPASSPQLLPASPQRSRAISISIILASVLVTLAFIGQYTDRREQPSNVGDNHLPFPTNASPAPKPPLASSTPPQSPAPYEEPRRETPAPPSATPSLSAGTPPTSPTTPPRNAPLASPQTESASPSDVSPLRQPGSIGGLPHVLRAQATEATWIRVHADGQPPKEMILRPGQAAEWTSNSPFQLTLGNAGGVTLNLDGKELPALGKSGQVIRNIQLPSLSPEVQG